LDGEKNDILDEEDNMDGEDDMDREDDILGGEDDT
jgi:hypothetical protein